MQSALGEGDRKGDDFCANLEDRDKETEVFGGAPQTLKNGADFPLGPSKGGKSGGGNRVSVRLFGGEIGCQYIFSGKNDELTPDFPKRTVCLGNSPSGRILPREVETAKNVDRNSLLEELQHDLDELLGTTTNLLRSAGAVAVRANREQLRQIVRHPLVRAVRGNRRLKPGNVAG
jgi:hypothetical protein